MTALKRAQRCATVAFRCVDANARDPWGERWGHGERRNAREISLGNAQKIHSMNEFNWNERMDGWMTTRGDSMDCVLTTDAV